MRIESTGFAIIASMGGALGYVAGVADVVLGLRLPFAALIGYMLLSFIMAAATILHVHRVFRGEFPPRHEAWLGSALKRAPRWSKALAIASIAIPMAGMVSLADGRDHVSFPSWSATPPMFRACFFAATTWPWFFSLAILLAARKTGERLARERGVARAPSPEGSRWLVHCAVPRSRKQGLRPYSPCRPTTRCSGHRHMGGGFSALGRRLAAGFLVSLAQLFERPVQLNSGPLDGWHGESTSGSRGPARSWLCG